METKTPENKAVTPAENKGDAAAKKPAAAAIKDQIAAALKTLDGANDDHWTKSGKPAVDAVNAALGQEVKRKDITDAAPDFARPEQKAETSGDGAQDERPKENPDSRGLTDADHAAMDHSGAKTYRFTRTGIVMLSGNGRIYGDEGDECALQDSDAKRHGDLLELVEAEETE